MEDLQKKLDIAYANAMYRIEMRKRGIKNAETIMIAVADILNHVGIVDSKTIEIFYSKEYKWVEVDGELSLDFYTLDANETEYFVELLEKYFVIKQMDEGWYEITFKS